MLAKSMKLYDHPLAFNPAKARLIFAEKGIKPVVQVVDLFAGAGLTPGFLKINPAGSVPVLVDGPTVITESRAIIDYVDNHDGHPLGGQSVDRPFVKEWLDQVDAFDGNLYFAGHGPEATKKILATLAAHRKRIAEANMKRYPDMAEVYAKKLEGMKKSEEEPKDPSIVSRNLSQLTAMLDLAEERLAVHPYLGGDEYSSADVIFTPVLFRIGMVGKMDQLVKPRPYVSEYYDRLKARPSFKTVFGPQLSQLTAGSYVLPALARAWASKLFNCY